MKKAFGDVDFVKAEGVDGEYGFVTEVMAEKDFDAKAGQLTSVIAVIRGNF